MKIDSKHFAYLDELRESGRTNMFGARPYLQETFGIDKKDAGDVLSAWMRTYSADETVEQRVKKAEGA